MKYGPDYTTMETKTTTTLGRKTMATMRIKDPHLGTWMAPDPMCEKYYDLSPYAYCAGDPVNFVDPLGLKIRGVTKEDVQEFQEDINTVLADEKFADIRSLFVIKGKTFNRIDEQDLETAKNKISLTDDENAYISMLATAINSKKVYTVEYVDGEFVSSKGASAIVNYFNESFGEGVGDSITKPSGDVSSSLISHSGGGLNVPTANGSHSFIIKGFPSKDRAVTSGHEVLGHGIPSAKGLSNAENNSNAIRAENLIRRILKLPSNDGSTHGGYQSGQIVNPFGMPLLK